jgi:hypothetical protein
MGKARNDADFAEMNSIVTTDLTAARMDEIADVSDIATPKTLPAASSVAKFC